MIAYGKATASSKPTGNKSIQGRRSYAGGLNLGWPLSIALGVKEMKLNLCSRLGEAKSCEDEDFLKYASRKTMREIIVAQKSIVEYWQGRSIVEQESKSNDDDDLSKAKKLFLEAQDQIENLRGKLAKTKEQLSLAQDELVNLREKASHLEEENDMLYRNHSTLKKSNALLRFHYGSRPLLDFPHLQPRDKKLQEGDRHVGEYNFLAELGAGHLGTVFASKNSLNESVAIKKIDKKDLDDYSFVLRLNDEIKTLKAAKHPNIVKLKETLHGDRFFYLVFEKAQSDLHSYSTEVGLTEEELRQAMLGLFRGLRFIHSQSIAHLDIKPDNILVVADQVSGPVSTTKQPIAAAHIRLCDFELCHCRGSSGDGRILLQGGHVMGTTNFFAPELSLETEIVDGALADMWSAGATLLELACDFPAEWQESYEFWDDSSNLMDEIDAFLRPYREDNLEPVKDLLFNKLLVPPEKRMRSVDVVLHPWLSDETV